MQKWIPVIDRLFPTTDSTMAPLLSLTISELHAILDTPNPNELPELAVKKLPLDRGKPVVPAGKVLALDLVKIEVAKNWTKQYHEKLQEYVQEAEEIERKILEARESANSSGAASNGDGVAEGIVAKAAAGTTSAAALQKKKNAAALRALNGTDFTSNETGPVQRVRLDKNGTTWDALEKIEKKVASGAQNKAMADEKAK